MQHGTRHIISSMEGAGHRISMVFACGGLSKNQLFIQTHADVTGIRQIVVCIIILNESQIGLLVTCSSINIFFPKKMKQKL